MNQSPVPRLDLAPKRRKPLSLWNPLDYLVLIYWTFFFPQALRWYVEQFGKPEYQKVKGLADVRTALRNDPIQLRLVVQALVCILLGLAVIEFALDVIGINLDWKEMVFSVGFGVAFSLIISVSEGVVWGVVWCMGLCMSFGIGLGVADQEVFGVPKVVADGIALIMAIDVAQDLPNVIAISLAMGMVGVVSVGVAGGVAVRMARGVTGSMVLSVILAMAIGVPFNIVFGMPSYMALILAIGIALSVAIGRILDWLLIWPISVAGRVRAWNRMVWLPLPSQRQILERWLEREWYQGVHNVNQVLAYTLQFIPAVYAVNNVSANLPKDRVLSRIALLVDHTVDWSLLKFGSSELKYQLFTEAIEGIFLLPEKWRRAWQARYPTDLRLDTPARAACAGFWYWHEGETDGAAVAFHTVQDITHGRELHGIAQSFVIAENATNLADLENWKSCIGWLDTLPDPELRSATLKALRILRKVAEEATTSHHAQSSLNRSAALNRASAVLNEFIETVTDSCPEPESPILKRIAERWQDIVINVGGEVGTEVLRQPVLNPYEGYSGRPVLGHTFVGRRDILTRLETLFAGGSAVPAIFLFGHRRMGKTSILRNLDNAMPAGMVLVYLDMQDAGFVDHTGELLLDLAEAIHRQTVQAGLDAGPAPVKEDYANLGSGRRALNALLERLKPQMSDRRLILAVDEFEIIEARIEQGRVDAGLLGYLRALGQKYPWLALVLGGLHTLDEMGKDYKAAFFGGQAEHVAVGYLSHDDAIRLITRPHPDFALEYAPELREKLYRLSHGQPYLLQRLCWELVNRWNERFLAQGENTPRMLQPEDLESVLTDDFYRSAEYYFDGVWNNVSVEERDLMYLISQREELWTAEELKAQLGACSVDDALERLRKHDVIKEDHGRIHIASELLRRWVARRKISAEVNGSV